MIPRLLLLGSCAALVACAAPALPTTATSPTGHGQAGPTGAEDDPAQSVPEAEMPAGSGECALSERPPQIALDALVVRLEADQAVAVDANGSVARRAFGVIPGAIRLSSFDEFALTELPDDRDTELVFYCSNHRCSAAPYAARLAMDQGYCNVQVYPGGIMGWVAAGQAVQGGAG
ncbi:MAG: rhodanese-like domain-containing protein [Deltaproteobacteria bacterium]|nr:rhodanese-like domain-containing protein [Deltaproteobacteria bacterium]